MFKKLLLVILLVVCIPTIHAQTVAYVTNGSDKTVSVIDTSTNSVTTTIPVGTVPQGVAFSPDRTRAYVTNRNDNSISVIDTAGNTVIATVPLLPNSFLLFPGVTPDGKSLYVPDGVQGVQVVSTATNSVVATIPLATHPVAVVFSLDGARAYVLGAGPGLVAVIDTASNTVVQSISVSFSNGNSESRAIAITPDGRHLYVADGEFANAEVIDATTNTNVATIPLPAPFPGEQAFGGVAITPDGSRVYVADGASNVDIIDTATNTVEATQIPVGNGPINVAVTPDGAFVYVANQFGNTVSVIATATNTVVATVPVGSSPTDIAIANLSAPGTASSIASNFNGTAIPSGDSLWFSAVTKVSGLGSKPVTISLRGSSISFTANGTKTKVQVPDADLTFDPSATTATTTFNASLRRWQSKVPSSGLAGNVFLDGAQLPLPSGLPGGIQNVTWSASFSTDTAGISLNWQWAAAAYTALDLNCSSSSPDLNCLGVKPVDDNKASQYQNSDPAGTPENSKANVVGGATGGGGSNFTGGLSGTNSVNPKVVP